MPVTKHNYLITDIKDLPMALKEAFYIARTGRPGPVLVDICKDVQQASMEFEYPADVDLPGYRSEPGCSRSRTRFPEQPVCLMRQAGR